MIGTELVHEAIQIGLDPHKRRRQLVFATRGYKRVLVLFSQVDNVAGNDRHSILAGYAVQARECDRARRGREIGDRAAARSYRGT